MAHNRHTRTVQVVQTTPPTAKPPIASEGELLSYPPAENGQAVPNTVTPLGTVPSISSEESPIASQTVANTVTPLGTVPSINSEETRGKISDSWEKIGELNLPTGATTIAVRVVRVAGYCFTIPTDIFDRAEMQVAGGE